MSKTAIAPETLEDIKQRVDIVDVISEYVVLRKRGQSLVGLCPFHEEKGASFTVNPNKQLYHCFGCGAGGNAIKFLMEIRKQSFYDVVLDLARRYQIPIKTLSPEKHQEIQRQLSLQEQLYEILAVATSFYQHTLRQPQGEVALTYVKNTRKLTEETIGKFQLGYAPPGWETLYRYLVEQKRYPLALVEQAGLIKPRKSGSGYYDQFRDRLMIPILDPQGRVIAFGSRTLGTDEPKYLNSPDTPLFDKSKTLFALDKAAVNISKQDQAIVVEGYFDAIAFHAVGINNVVASLGTAFSQFQLKQLLRYTESKRVIFNFDSDQAGINATQRAIAEIADLVYGGQVQLKILNLPAGKDADEFLNSSPDAIEKMHQLLQNAPLWFNWQIQQLLKQYDLKQGDQFQMAAQKMVKLLSQLNNPHQQTYYIGYCAQILSQNSGTLVPLQFKRLEAEVNRYRVRAFKRPEQEDDRQIVDNSNKLEEAEALLLRIYLHCPENREEIQQTLDDKDLLFSLSHHRFLWQQILLLQTEINQMEDPENNLLSLLQNRLLTFPDKMEQLKHLFHLKDIHLISNREEYLLRPSINIQQAIESLEIINLEKYRDYCLKQLHKIQPSPEKERLSQELLNTLEKLRELDKHKLETELKQQHHI